MESDLELREFIAVKLMGWKLRHDRPIFEPHGYWAPPYSKGPGVLNNEVWVEFVKCYERDIAAAFEADSAMSKKGRKLVLRRLENGNWFANYEGCQSGVVGDTAPRAICLAARAALKQEKA